MTATQAPGAPIELPGAVPAGFLAGWPSDERGLVLRLGERLSLEDVHEIASSDYGQDLEGHKEAVNAIRATGIVPAPLDWVPREVLQLSSYWEPDHERGKPEKAQAFLLARGHRIRAFCCAALAIFHAQNPELAWTTPVRALLSLARSLDALPDQPVREAAAAMACLIARHEAQAEPGLDAYIGMALLRFVLGDPGRTDADILALLDWIMRSGDARTVWERESFGCTSSAPWPVGGEGYPLDEEWAGYLGELADRAAALRGGPVVEGIRLVASAMGG